MIKTLLKGVKSYKKFKILDDRTVDYMNELTEIFNSVVSKKDDLKDDNLKGMEIILQEQLNAMIEILESLHLGKSSVDNIPIIRPRYDKLLELYKPPIEWASMCGNKTEQRILNITTDYFTFCRDNYLTDSLKDSDKDADKFIYKLVEGHTDGLAFILLSAYILKFCKFEPWVFEQMRTVGKNFIK